MKINKTGIAAITTLAACALAACNDPGFIGDDCDCEGGGGGDGGDAEGFYVGDISGSPAGVTAFSALIQENGDFWVFYGDDNSSEFTVRGFAAGTGSASTSGTFASSEGRDYGSTPPATLTLEAAYTVVDDVINGEFTTAAGTTSFSGGPIANSDYVYAATADLALLAGTWDVEDMLGVDYQLLVAADGSFNFTEQGGGCSGDGTFTPRAAGKNVFNVSLSFDNVVGCDEPGAVANGIAIAYEVTGNDTIQLLAAVVDGQETFGFSLSGLLPIP